MEIVNLTSHTVSVVNKDGNVVVCEASGYVARVPYELKEYGTINGISVYKKVYGEINFSTDIEPYKVYIVSTEIIRALKEFNHPLAHQFVAPNTNWATKDENGTILKVNGFAVV